MIELTINNNWSPKILNRVRALKVIIGDILKHLEINSTTFASNSMTEYQFFSKWVKRWSKTNILIRPIYDVLHHVTFHRHKTGTAIYRSLTSLLFFVPLKTWSFVYSCGTAGDFELKEKLVRTHTQTENLITASES